MFTQKPVRRAKDIMCTLYNLNKVPLSPKNTKIEVRPRKSLTPAQARAHLPDAPCQSGDNGARGFVYLICARRANGAL